ncbi:MAG: FAD-dependent oxidoreductase [Clostridiales bacterium]|nr:FAD-dependent oxidoreductase [Clostridiales bacterium]
MIQITQIRMLVGHSDEALTKRIRKILRLDPEAFFTYKISKKSIDARKKSEVLFIYTVLVETEGEEEIVRRLKNPSVTIAKEIKYVPRHGGILPKNIHPIIVGAGPAGLFAALTFVEAGYEPVILERGKPVEERRCDVEKFWVDGILDPESNVQFGEGGAGTFSDGKLNTAVKDKSGKIAYVLSQFVRFGADEEILYEARPHIGTDRLIDIIKNIRNYLTAHGTKIFFNTRADKLLLDGTKCVGVAADGEEHIGPVVLAIGHSARDTFVMLDELGVPMESKDFAVGFRIEHPQRMVDEAMYGKFSEKLPPAPYKLAANFKNGRGVYSFCMCPGGFVVNASSEQGGTCVNGMSYAARDAKNANSAIVVTVSADDFGGADALAGMRYQRRIERENYIRGGGKIPQQLLGDFIQGVISKGYGDFPSCAKGGTAFANLREILDTVPEHAFLDGMAHFSKIIENFDRGDAILSGMETRTSSPVRILRGENCESVVSGLYPCGEGAGYAGGIVSAAVDGIRVAQSMLRS